jgi:hypothetical protein
MSALDGIVQDLSGSVDGGLALNSVAATGTIVIVL